MKSKADILWLDTAESSNDEARKAIDSLDNLSVMAVRCQTAGRGQGTNNWESAPGQNLTFSIVLKDFDILPKQQIAISQITALSVVKFLEQQGIQARIKLPNDIYVGDRKICGILIENSLCANCIKWSIVGIGINVNQTVFPTSLPNPTSILLEKAMGQNQRASEAKRQAPASDHKTQHEPELDLSQLLAQFHEIYSEYYSSYICCNRNFQESCADSRRDSNNISKTNLEELDQLFQSKLQIINQI